MGVQEPLALKQALLVGIDVGDGVQRGPRQGHEAVLHLHRGLPHHVTFVLGEQVVDLPDSPGGAVLDGQDGVVRPPLPQGQEAVLKLLQSGGVCRGAEEVQGGLLAVRPRLPLVHHPGGGYGPAGIVPGLLPAQDAGVVRPLAHQIPLLPPGQGHHRLVQGDDGGAQLLPRQLPLVLEHLPLPGLVQHRDAPLPLVLAHPGRHVHPAAEQLHHLPVDGVNLPPQILQAVHQRYSSLSSL